MAGSNSSGILDSLRLYDAARLNAMEVTRHEGSNIDHVVTSEGEEFPLCHLSGLVPFTYGDFVPQMVGFEAAATIALAAQHLNTGDGSIVPEVAGLDKRCKVRFTVEFADTQFSEGAALNHVITQTKREVGSLSEQNPCAFIGAYRSAVSIPTSIVTGLLGYPQISAASTSAELDDKSLFPLFGRTLPSDAGNAVPIVKFMHDILKINHLAVVNVNDSFGNNFIEGLRNAAAIHAPSMKIIQTPLDEEQGSIKDAVASLKATGFRFIFCLVFTPTTHDALLTEGFEQGIAGTGHHNWIFADSFSGTLGDRTFKKGSPLHLAYRGSSVIEVSGGVPGIPRFDSFEAKLSELRNPADLAYLGPRFPVYDDPRYGTDIPFVGSDSFLSTVKDSYAPFHYEAAISLGLAACSAYEDNASFSGQEHFERLKELDFTGISGNVVFDPITGTREPSSAIYKVTNQVVQDVDQDNIAFKPVVTNIFQGDAWDEVVPYLFNDGTATLPNDTDPSPPESSGPSLGIVIGASVACVVILGLVLWICYERRRKRNSTVWEVKEEDLIFSDPPEVIGQGTFGVVHLAEYRGTAVAVKRVIPPSSSFTKKGSVMDSEEPSDASSSSGLNSLSKLGKARGADSGSSSWNKVSGEPLASWGNMSLGHLRSMGRSAPNSLGMFGKKAPNVAAQWKKMKQDFIEEMQYLSKLRHPCITTIMGAVLSNDPKIVLEYFEHGSLYDLLHNETIFIEGNLILPILRDVSQGVRFLHSADPQVIHGDLKAANILVDRNFRAKVADFGLSRTNSTGSTGTPFWMAPELLRREHGNSAASDVFSFGIILYEVYSRRDPYEGEGNAKEILRLVCDQAIKKRPEAPISMPDKVKSLMADCVEDEPDKRPTFEELDKRLQRIDSEGADPNETPKIKTGISLFDIFPRHIAEALRDGRTVEPEHKDCVTIFFSDIAGFTDLSSSLSPRQVADLLGRLYTSFDKLAEKHDIFKVETIGDAYVAVTNLVKDQHDDHAKRIAQFAIDAILAANTTPIDPLDPEKGCVNIRCGFHCGPVVADVVGTSNPRYCLFGDSVNTASRMESNSKLNRILCSASAYELLRVQCPEISVASRGIIPVKGKGTMKTYWVNEQGEEKKSCPENLSTKLHVLHEVPDESEEFGRSDRTEVAEAPQSSRETPQTAVASTVSVSAEDIWIRKVMEEERAERIRKATERLQNYKASLRGDS